MILMACSAVILTMIAVRALCITPPYLRSSGRELVSVSFQYSCTV